MNQNNNKKAQSKENQRLHRDVVHKAKDLIVLGIVKDSSHDKINVS